MNKLFSEFPKTSKEKWVEKLTQELKGADFDSSLLRKDALEELEYVAFSHATDQLISPEIPGQHPFTRGGANRDNKWENAAVVFVDEEKTANTKALNLLMNGCTCLIFELPNRKLDLPALLDAIEFEYISAQFAVASSEQLAEIRAWVAGREKGDLVFRCAFETTLEMIGFISPENEPSSDRFCFVNGYEFQQCGATIMQQVGFMIATGHEYLIALLKKGYSADQAAASIHFSIGIGSNYFHEIAKIRALRKVWSQVVRAYDPKDEHSSVCMLTAEIGHINKSLKDPYTNLLRQTTEVMSAVNGGIQQVVVHPFDSKSIEGSCTLSERMALNISLILKEESYFDKVIDPTGGSYSLEALTEQIGKKSWANFQAIDAQGGIREQSAIAFIREAVKEKVQLRLERLRSGKEVLIGVTNYPNPEPESKTWLPSEFFLGMKKVVFERDL
jgi:methylmalonyl-CoA mutase